MSEKRSVKVPKVSVKYASADGKVQHAWERQLDSVSSIRPEISDGSFARWLEHLDGEARRLLGADCVLAEIKVRVEVCFFMEDYEVGMIMPPFSATS